MNAFSPISETVLSAVLAVYDQSNSITTLLVGLIISMRMVFLLGQFAGGDSYAEVFKDLIAFLGISSLFPMLLRLLLSVINWLTLKFSYNGFGGPEGESLGFVLKLFGDSKYLEVLASLGDVFIAALSKAAYTAILAVFVAIAPIVFLIGLTFGMRGKISFYFSTLTAICLWPVLWNLLGLLGSKLSSGTKGSQIASISFAIVIYTLQLLSPVFSILLFTTLNPASAVKKATTLMRIK